MQRRIIDLWTRQQGYGFHHGDEISNLTRLLMSTPPLLESRGIRTNAPGQCISSTTSIYTLAGGSSHAGGLTT